MKSDAHLYLTTEPLWKVDNGTMSGLCGKEVTNSRVCFVWDDVPTGTRLEAEKLVGICRKCIKKLAEEPAKGNHILYAIGEYRGKQDA